MLNNIDYSKDLFSMNDYASEGFFVFDEKGTEEILALIKDRVNAMDDLEELEKIALQVEAEIVEYNKLLGEVASAINDFKAGNISKNDMLAVTTPALKELRANSKAMGLIATDDIFGDEEDITTDEVAAIKEVIVGTKIAVDERIAAIKDEAGADLAGKGNSVHTSTDSWATMLNKLSIDVAEEGLGRKMGDFGELVDAKAEKVLAGNNFTEAFVNSNDYKKIKDLYEEGKKLVKKDPKNAIKILTECKKLIKSNIEKISNKFKDHKREIKVSAGYGSGVIGLGFGAMVQGKTYTFGPATAVMAKLSMWYTNIDKILPGLELTDSEDSLLDLF